MTISCVISGHAAGADTLGEEWAERNSIPLEIYPAKWGEYGKSAGFIRNREMAERAEGLIALWDGKSAGTNNMINIAKRIGLAVHVEITL